jgi:hypothetical protein
MRSLDRDKPCSCDGLFLVGSEFAPMAGDAPRHAARRVAALPDDLVRQLIGAVSAYSPPLSVALRACKSNDRYGKTPIKERIFFMPLFEI